MTSRHISDIPKWIFLALWFIGNVALFSYTFWKYWYWDDFYYLRMITGMTVAFSRGAAAALNLNCALILLPVCRNLISFLRGSCPFGKTLIWRHLDKNLTFHKLCGYSICFWTVIHVIGHTFNIERYLFAQRLPDDPPDLRHELSELPITPNGTWVNPVRDEITNPMYEVVTMIPGVTGIIATLSLILMFSSSTEFIRRNCFEFFWYIHHLFVVFFIALIIHGFGGVVRAQSNLQEHDYHQCQDRAEEWNKIPECPVPQFKPKVAETWMWVIGPLTLYAIERLIRLYRQFQKVTIIGVIRHPSQVIELRMQKAGFRMKAGQYIFINIPAISRFQWHPFTLTSAPEDDYFSVHIRQVGDWTEALGNVLCCNSTTAVDISQMPKVSVDGPFGTCSEDVFEYRVAILVGGGIGVTPFSSILRHIWYRHSEPSTRLMKVYFYWVSSDVKAFEWFVERLDVLEKQMEQQDTSHFIEIEMYWTRGWNDKQREQIISAVSDPRDPITKLRHQTKFGRPNWEQVFTNIKQRHQNERIGVFFCGPKEMSAQLHQMSDKHSSLKPTGTRFIYNKENF